MGHSSCLAFSSKMDMVTSASESTTRCGMLSVSVMPVGTDPSARACATYAGKESSKRKASLSRT